MTAPTQPARPSRTQRLSDGLLVVIVLSVGIMAGAASFNHVHDWTMHNSPTGTGSWFGWANAVITELIPTAALIIIARRRRHGGRIGYPIFLLIIAVSLSLTAQLAVAVPTVFGWMVSALPAAAFFALSKLVFTTTGTTDRHQPAPASAQAAVDQVAARLDTFAARIHELETRPPEALALTPARPAPSPSPEATDGATPRPVAKKTTAKKTTSARRPPAKKTSPATTPTTPAHPDPPAPQATEPPVPVMVAEPVKDLDGMHPLLPNARIIAQAHHDAHGEAITANQLATRMRIGTPVARQILDQLDTIPTAANTQPHNGTPVTGMPA